MSATCIETTCPYCGVGCGVAAAVTDNRVSAIAGSSAHPANQGKLCIKGTHLADTLQPAGRLGTPEIDGGEATWDQATDLIAHKFTDVAEQYGPQAIAFYLSGQLLTEDYYVANKLMKGFIGSANVDTNSRLCMASAVAAHKRAFGEDIVPCTYADVEQSELVILAGSNAAWAHPVLYQRLVAARQTRDIKVVVIDPRRTSTCDVADLHLPINPGSDAALFNGLLSHIVASDCFDPGFVAAHTTGFDDTLKAASMSVDAVAHSTGLAREQVLEFFRLFVNHSKTVTLFSQGINQSTSGTDKANAIINCHLAAGRIGKPGQGPFSITGQPNAMGGREVGGMANQLAAHMNFEPEHVDRVQRFWHAPNMVDAPGLTAVNMFEAVARGFIKAIWIMGTNPAVSLPDSKRVRQALNDCPFVVVSDCIKTTDTNKYANVLLPAQGWGEKDGTVTNSERCISRQRRLVAPYAQARPDWQIMCDVAGKMGFADAFQYASAGDIFSEHARLTGFENDYERVFDISAMAPADDAEYDNLTPTYWPPKGQPFADGVFPTDDGKARFVPVQVKAPVQLSDSTHPLILNTGRVRDQWHTMSRTGLADKLFSHTFSPVLQINPVDAGSCGIASGDLVEVANARGHVRLLAEVTTDTQPGLLFAPIHWNDQFAYQACVSQLVAPVTDPVSGQPESKHAPVNCRVLQPQQWARLVTRNALDTEALHNTDLLDYWVGSPVAGGWQYELAMSGLQPLLALLATEDMVTYADSQGGQRMLGRQAGEAQWLLFSSPARHELPPLTQMVAQLQCGDSDWRKLTTLAAINQDTSAMVCTCFEVREAKLRAHIEAGASSAAQLGAQLKCGTNCGSCVPEINNLLAQMNAGKAIEAVG